MFIKQLYTAYLSEAAYYIESNGQAAIVDPLCDIEEYIVLAKQRNATIKYIFQTHFQVHLVSGHIDLSKKTGASIIYGPNTKTNYPVKVAIDGETFILGNVSFETLHTPGHTPESTCYLLKDVSGNDHAVFTGNTLFVGDVGTSDLEQQDNALTKDDLAAVLYESLQSKIIPLKEDVLVYSTHGSGSNRGKNLVPNTYSTIGEEKRTNYALQAKSKTEFIKLVSVGLSTAPTHFNLNATINKEGNDSLKALLKNALQALSIEVFKEKYKNEGFIILDTRAPLLFTLGFIPSSINIGLNGRFSEWAGMLLPFNSPIILVTEIGKEEESIIRMARIGFNTIAGYLEGGFEAWQNAREKIDMLIEVEADELAMDLPHDINMVVIDVRGETEFANGHIKGAVNIPLNDMTDPGSMAHLEDTQNLYVHCAAGYRSVIAASLLKRQGIHNLRNVSGGWLKIKEQKDIPIVKEASALN